MSTVNFGGLASGLDTESIIKAMVDVARGPINIALGKKAALSGKLDAYSTLSSQLSRLKTAAQGLDSLRDFRALTATSSDETQVSAVASSTASPGTYVLGVSALAQAERTYSDPFASKDTAGLFGSGTLTITDGAGTPIDVDVTSSDTLSDVADKINSSGAAVTSSVVYDGSSYRLLVMGEDTGAANAVSFAEGGTLVLNLDDPANEAQAAVDASVSMDGLSISSATNQLTDLIPGVTLDLEDTTGAGTVTIGVGLDSDAMASKVQDFVSAYNDVASFLHTQFQYAGEARTDTLMGESTARTVKARLQEILGDEVAGVSGDYTQLRQIGVKTESDGTLTFDTGTFTEALANDAAGVIDLFAHDDGDDDLDADGVALRVGNAITSFLNADGLLDARQDGLTKSISNIDDRVARLEDHLGSYETMLRKQFAAMEQAISGYQSTGSFLSQQTY